MVTKEEAHARLLKAWKTRHQHTGDFAVGGGSLLALGATATPAVNRYQHQHVWHRPNNQDVLLKGFTKRDLDSLKPAFDQVDRNLRSNIRLGDPKTGLQIRKQTSLIHRVIGAEAVTQPSIDTIWGELQPKIADQPPSTIKVTHHLVRSSGRALGARPFAQIKVPPKTTRTTEASTILAHELAHTVDYSEKFSKTKRWRRQAGWKHNASTPDVSYKNAEKNLSRLNEGKKQPFYTPKYKAGAIKTTRLGMDYPQYQATAPFEDFAETFRSSLGFSSKTQGLEAPRLDPSRERYMRGKILRGEPSGVSANISRVPGMHNHLEAFVVGGVAATTAAYGGYRYHRHKYLQDANYQASWDRRRAKLIPGRRFDAPGSITRTIRRRV